MDPHHYNPHMTRFLKLIFSFQLVKQVKQNRKLVNKKNELTVWPLFFKEEKNAHKQTQGELQWCPKFLLEERN